MKMKLIGSIFLRYVVNRHRHTQTERHTQTQSDRNKPLAGFNKYVLTNKYLLSYEVNVLHVSLFFILHTTLSLVKFLVAPIRIARLLFSPGDPDT